MSIKILFGKRIKDLRIKHNLKQAQIAEIVGIDPKHQSCIENGKNFPSTDLIEKYAKAFGIDAVELLKMENYKSKEDLINKINIMLNSAEENDILLIYKICLDIIK